MLSGVLFKVVFFVVVCFVFFIFWSVLILTLTRNVSVSSQKALFRSQSHSNRAKKSDMVH